MAFEHSIQYRLTGATPSAISRTVARTASGEVSINETIPGPSTDFVINVAIDQSEMESLFMLCDKDCEVHTNTLSGTDDLTLKAGEPLIWQSGGELANPLTADVTSFHIVMGDDDDASFECYILQDATP